MRNWKRSKRFRSFHKPADAVPTPQSVTDSIRARIDLCESQLAALASKQSQVISTRQELEQCFDSLLAQYEGKEVPLPAGWGGFRLRPESIEFWQNRDDRLHDRLFYTLDSEGKWRIDRLSP